MSQRELLDQQRKARLGKFRGLVAGIRHDVNGIVAVGVVSPAGAAAEHFAREKWLAVGIAAEEAGISDGLLVGGHAALDRLRDHAREQPETAQQHEGARIGCRRPVRRDQRALRREYDVEDLAHAFVDVDLGGALGRVGEVAQDRRDPFDQKSAVGVVGRPIDRDPAIADRFR